MTTRTVEQSAANMIQTPESALWAATSVINQLANRMNLIIARELADQVMPGAVAGLAVDGVNPENIEMTNTVYVRHKGLLYLHTAVAELDISALTAGGDTVAQTTHGVLWVYLNTAGTGDVETDKAAQDYATLIEAFSAFSVAANTLPPGTDDVCIGAVLVLEGGSGVFTWGTDSITVESETYYDFFGLPGIEIAMASFALDAAAATFTYGAVTIRLGDGTVTAATGKANVVIAGSNVADGDVGAWLFYVQADDVERAEQLSATYADLATAEDGVRDHNPNPYLALAGILFVENASGANFVPGTTNLDAAGITATFTTLGPGADQLEVGRAQLNQPYAIADDITTRKGGTP